MNQFRRAALGVRGLPTRLRGRIAWRQAGQALFARGRAFVPVAQRAFTGVGKGLDRGASELGRSAVAGSRGLRSLSHVGAHGLRSLSHVGTRGLRRLSHLTARGLALAARASRIAGVALARATRRVAADGARVLGRLFAYLWQRRSFLRALALRGAWWAALALLWFGGRALFDLRAPLAQDALPLFLVGLALCMPLFFAAAARLRWAGFALGAGHAVLAVLVWTITTSG